MGIRNKIGGAVAARLPVWIAAAVAALAAALGVLSGGAGQAPPTPPAKASDLPVLDEVAIEYEGLPFESHALGERHQDGAAFPDRRITWALDTAGVSAIRPATTTANVRAALAEAWSSWATGLDIEPVEVDPTARPNVVHRFGAIDGAGRTLAWSMLGDGTANTKEQRYDTGETWSMGGPVPNQISLPAVAAHEIGHALGLDHDSATADSLMRPYYTSSITKPTERDFVRATTIGYRRRPIPPPLDPSDNGLSLTLKVKPVDLADVLKRAGWRVDPPSVPK